MIVIRPLSQEEETQDARFVRMDAEGRAKELQRLALVLSLQRNRRVTLSALVREALEAQWPSKGVGRRALLEAAALQAEHQRDADPAERYLHLVSRLLASGRAHLYEVSGLRPANADRFGWRREQRDQEDVWKPQGRLVGWVEDESGAIYLEPDAAFAEVQRFATEQGTPLPVTMRTMSKRLFEKGLLARTDSARGKILVRKSVQDQSRKVLALRADVFERLDASA